MVESVKIHLGIATFRRPAGLSQLLSAVKALIVPKDVALLITVADNSPEGSALAALETRGVAALHVPEPGLARVRNALLSHALPTADYMAFLDDDEVVTPTWLEEHLAAQAASGASATQGAVSPIFVSPPPKWLSAGRFLEQTAPEDLARLPEAASNNILFDLAPVRRADLRFDTAFDHTGGEDTAFFRAYVAAGGTIAFAANATAWESTPEERLTFAWNWRRWRASGRTGAILAGDSGARAAVSGAARLAAGGALAFAAAPLAPFGWPALWARGARIAARGAGFLDAATGQSLTRYGPAAHGR